MLSRLHTSAKSSAAGKMPVLHEGQRKIAAKNPRSFRKNERFGPELAGVVVADRLCASRAGGGSGAFQAGAATGRESRGNARTSSTGAGGGPLAWNTKGASTCT